MKMKIPHVRLSLNNKEQEAVKRVIESGYLAEGEEVRKFERLICKKIKVKYGCAVNSGTSALHLSLKCLDVYPGDEVILPSYLCTSPMNSINYTGAKTVLVDINKDDFTMNISDVENKISKRTKAIIVPHMFGAPVDMDRLKKLNIPIIEDCAHSLGAKYKSKFVGSIGRLSMFSFYATKLLGAGFGGMVCSNVLKYINKVRDWIDFDERENYIERYNYKMGNLTAAIASEQVKKLNGFIKRRRQIAQKYNKLLKDTNLILPKEKKYAYHIFYRYIVPVPSKSKKIIQYLADKGIETKGPVYKPLHRYLKMDDKNFKNTVYVYNRALSLPIYPSLTDKEIEYIVDTLKKGLRKID